MTTDNNDYRQRSPDAMLQVFSRSRMIIWCLVAVGIHLLLMLATSTGYIRDRIDPEGAAKRKEEAAKAAAKPTKADAAAKPTKTDADAKPTKTGSAEDPNGSKPLTIDGVVVPKSAAGSETIKNITSTPGADDPAPGVDDLDLDLGDTKSQ
ncbi:MAG: hypothetical protein HRT89_17335 [Lentisphaeria bacterium]|nr:hypothetical protein [Lentisphaeria bacterium]NQZ69822.1 hypothetical protein [Lentisphaeria bacterium]